MTGFDDYITTIGSMRLAEDQPMDDGGLSDLSIDIPQEIVMKFASNGGGELVRAVSFLYYNVTDFFPGEFPEGGNK